MAPYPTLTVPIFACTARRLFSFKETPDADLVALRLTNQDGSVEDDAEGNVTVYLSAADTASLPAGTYWSLWSTDPGVITVLAYVT